MSVHNNVSSGQSNPQTFKFQEPYSGNPKQAPEIFDPIISEGVMNRVAAYFKRPGLNECDARFTLTTTNINYVGQDEEYSCEKTSEVFRKLEFGEPLIEGKYEVLGLTICRYNSKNSSNRYCTKPTGKLSIREAIQIMDSQNKA